MASTLTFKEGQFKEGHNSLNWPSLISSSILMSFFPKKANGLAHTPSKKAKWKELASFVSLTITNWSAQVPNDPFYKTRTWKDLREACLQRDGHRCATKGCPNVASIADHVVSRRNGGHDVIGNLRSLCSTCDLQIREGTDGERKRGGVPIVRKAEPRRIKGCDASGFPLDRNHHWRR